VGHLPIVKHYADKLNLVETINAIVDSEMEIAPGTAVLAMVLDSLSGRTPLYRLKHFFEDKDTELLLGTETDPVRFCDHTIGRVLDKLFETGTKFVSRLPATYAECSRAIKEAVEADQWHDIGAISESTGTAKRPPAHYQIYETTITINGRDYRGLVVHSSAHDKRRHKRIDRLVAEKRKELEAICKEASTSYFCQPDALAAAEKLAAAASGSYHRVETQIKKVAKYDRGRPPKNQTRRARGYQYHLETKISQDPDAIAPLRLEAGCFVLITNLAEESELGQWSAKRLLQLYKNQHGIEQNFGFLKDPVIVNSIFLKSPQRIEVLGLVLLIALLIWRLMERSMRQYIGKHGRGDTRLGGPTNEKTNSVYDDYKVCKRVGSQNR
ncbi:MAG: IS1634 family transposase, partial [Desulfosalsimonas sp.]|uniref:IS1634 family transposase n=1 Tax=Desulfosalsimonas sp. TaxID=3073848 RepID=UPI003970EEFB